MNTVNLFNLNMSEIKVSYSHKVKVSEMKRVSSSKEAYDALVSVWEGNLDYIEYFYIILLNRANKILGYYQLSKGGTSGTIADIKCVFQVALKCSASSIILAHNHPGGNTQPSEQDIKLTKKIKDAGILLDIPVLDHIILTSESYMSFADDGLL